MTPQELFDSLGEAFGAKLQQRTEFRGETTYTIAASDLREIAKFCRDELSFDYLLDITSIDDFGEEPRFEIVFHFIRCRMLPPSIEIETLGRSRCPRHCFRYLADSRLARARDLRHDGHRV